MCDTELCGQIVHMRKLSKKMMFIDVFCVDSDEKDRQTLAIKFWNLSDEMWDRVNRGQNKLHVGDVVKFFGHWEQDLFSISDYNFLSKWSQCSTDTAFTPIPPPSTSKCSTNLKEKHDVHRVTVCKYYVNTGQCNTESCPFRHDADLGTLKSSRSNFVQDRLEKRILEHETQFKREDLESASKRANLFASWLESRYGKDYLKSGIILDVAGGRGDLAFELGVKLGYNCQIVDPRPQKLKRWQIKVLKKNVDISAPKHHTFMFDFNFFNQCGIKPEDVCLITGMHPDEATEVIMDTGLQFDIAVSIVPCCVFSSKFPDRRLREDGAVPTSLPQFIKYLSEKSENIKTGYLPFVGRNQVLYTLPASLVL